MISGPSSSGKTGLAINLAKEINGEIISVDSRQVYKELDIGTAKPDLEERQGIKHHLIDIVGLDRDYNAANFCDDAKTAVNQITDEGKIPILAGGTGLYFRVLLQDFDLPRVAPDKELREELNKKSCSELYNMLTEADKKTAEKIHFNNKVKIIRALEVCIKLNTPMSIAQKKKQSEFETVWIGLNSQNREYLYTRVNNRTDMMIHKGLIDEAESLFKKYGNNNILLNTIGYQEFKPYFDGEITKEKAIEQLKQNTRRYVKRQISWFKANKDIDWFDIETNSEDGIIEYIKNKYKNL